MLISKKTRKKLTVSALFAAPVAMTAVGAGVVSADTVHTPDETQNTVSTNSTTSSANSSAASSATSSATSANATEYQTVVVQPDSAMTNYLKQAAANGMKGEMVATITDGLHNNGDDTSDSIVTINDGGSVTVTLADVNTLAGTMTTTFSNGMVLTSTITNGKMSTQVTTEPTSGSASSATSSAASSDTSSDTSSDMSSDTSSDTSSSGNDSFSDAVSVHSSAASSAASSTASAAYEATTDTSTTRKPVSSDKYASTAYTPSEAVPSASRNASYAPSKSPAFPDTSGSLTSGTKVTAFTMNKNDPEYVKNHDGNKEYAKFSTNQSIDLFAYYWAKLKAAATDAGLSDSQYFKLLDAASQPGGDVYNKLLNDEDLTDDQKAELVTDAYQLARQIADKDSDYTLSNVNDDIPSNDNPIPYDDGDNTTDDDNTYGDDTDGDDTDGDDGDSSAKTLPQAGEEDTSSMSVAGMAMAGAVSLAGMIGSIRKRHELRNEDD